MNKPSNPGDAGREDETSNPPASAPETIDITLDLVRRLDGVHSLRMLGELLLALTKAFGVEHILAGALPQKDENTIDYSSGSFRDHWPLALLNRPIPQANIAPTSLIDPDNEITCHFSWNENKMNISYIDNKDKIYEIYKYMRTLEGIIFPIVTIAGKSYGFLFLGRKLDLTKHSTDLLSFITHYSFARMLKIDDLGSKRPGERPRLTARQRDVLKWAAEGKTDWEIATILGVSEHTVDKYIRQSKEALNASNRTAAIVLAIRCGLIS
jgi:LuxR family quorum sensing-dependent transcriptional regulator